MTSLRNRRIPIFPLPDVVFFPETLLPLHIFEPRYRTMVQDALEGDRTLGIQLMKPSPSPDPAGPPPVFEIGCAGEIVEHEPQEDGRSNILLKGLYRYRIEAEVPGLPYRVADVTALPVLQLDPAPAGGSPTRKDLRRVLARVVSHLADSVGRPEASKLPTHLSDEGLVNEALSRLGLDSEDRYRLLAMDRLDERYAWVVAHIGAIQARIDLLQPFRRSTSDPRWN